MYGFVSGQPTFSDFYDCRNPYFNNSLPLPPLFSLSTELASVMVQFHPRGSFAHCLALLAATDQLPSVAAAEAALLETVLASGEDSLAPSPRCYCSLARIFMRFSRSAFFYPGGCGAVITPSHAWLPRTWTSHTSSLSVMSVVYLIFFFAYYTHAHHHDDGCV